MTDEEIKKLYFEFEPDAQGDEDWWREAIDSVRRCIAAPTTETAVEILRKEEWGAPEAGALWFRERKTLTGKTETCPRCRGTGQIHVF